MPKLFVLYNKLSFSLKRIFLPLINQRGIGLLVLISDKYFDLPYEIYIIEDSFNVVNKIGFLLSEVNKTKYNFK